MMRDAIGRSGYLPPDSYPNFDEISSELFFLASQACGAFASSIQFQRLASKLQRRAERLEKEIEQHLARNVVDKLREEFDHELELWKAKDKDAARQIAARDLEHTRPRQQCKSMSDTIQQLEHSIAVMPMIEITADGAAKREGGHMEGLTDALSDAPGRGRPVRENVVKRLEETIVLLEKENEQLKSRMLEESAARSELQKQVEALVLDLETKSQEHDAQLSQLEAVTARLREETQEKACLLEKFSSYKEHLSKVENDMQEFGSQKQQLHHYKKLCERSEEECIALRLQIDALLAELMRSREIIQLVMTDEFREIQSDEYVHAARYVQSLQQKVQSLRKGIANDVLKSAEKALVSGERIGRDK